MVDQRKMSRIERCVTWGVNLSVPLTESAAAFEDEAPTPSISTSPIAAFVSSSASPLCLTLSARHGAQSDRKRSPPHPGNGKGKKWGKPQKTFNDRNRAGRSRSVTPIVLPLHELVDGNRRNEHVTSCLGQFSTLRPPTRRKGSQEAGEPFEVFLNFAAHEKTAKFFQNAHSWGTVREPKHFFSTPMSNGTCNLTMLKKRGPCHSSGFSAKRRSPCSFHSSHTAGNAPTKNLQTANRI